MLIDYPHISVHISVHNKSSQQKFTTKVQITTMQTDIEEKETPQQFICPIGANVMDDPVFLPDGNTYDRANIVRWMQQGNFTNPMTREPISNDDVRPNYALRETIEQWKKENANIIQNDKMDREPFKSPDAKNVILVIDTSWSMKTKISGTSSTSRNDNELERTERLSVIDAVNLCIQHLLDTLAADEENEYNLTLLTFSSKVNLVFSPKKLTKANIQVLNRRLELALQKVDGMTNLLNAVITSLDIGMKHIDPMQQCQVIVFTDGDPTVPELSPWENTIEGITTYLEMRHENKFRRHLPRLNMITFGRNACNPDNMQMVTSMVRLAQVEDAISSTPPIGSSPLQFPLGALFHIDSTRTIGPALINLASLIRLPQSDFYKSHAIEQYKRPKMNHLVNTLKKILEVTKGRDSCIKALMHARTISQHYQDNMKMKNIMQMANKPAAAALSEATASNDPTTQWEIEVDIALGTQDTWCAYGRSYVTTLLDAHLVAYPTSTKQMMSSPQGYIDAAYSPEVARKIRLNAAKAMLSFNRKPLPDKSIVPENNISRDWPPVPRAYTVTDDSQNTVPIHSNIVDDSMPQRLYTAMPVSYAVSSPNPFVSSDVQISDQNEAVVSSFPVRTLTCGDVFSQNHIDEDYIVESDKRRRIT